MIEIQVEIQWWDSVMWKYIRDIGASPVAHMVKNLTARQMTQFQSLGREDPLEKGMTTFSSIFFYHLFLLVGG